MWRVKLLIAALVCRVSLGYAQDVNEILEFIGTGSVEEISPYDMERLEDLQRHPLRINQVSVAKLGESGLFTRYQTASLEDYRSRHGDVLSFAELAVIDGFGEDFVSKVAPFVSLESSRLPGAPAVSGMKHELSARTGLKTGSLMTCGMKYRLTAGERLSGGLSVSRTSSAPSMSPDAFSGHVAFHGGRGKVVFGDYNARFGQGLAMWNGMSFSGLTSASSFMRRPSGISASSSFTGGYALRGMAADLRVGKFLISAFASTAKGKESISIMPAINLSCYLSHGQFSLTHYADFSVSGGIAFIPDMKTSVDMSFCLRGTDIFTEAAYDWVSSSVAALGGVALRAGENAKIAAMLRFYPSAFNASGSAAARSTTKCSNEHAASLAVDFNSGKWITLNGASGFGSSVRKHAGRLSADIAYFPVPKEAGAILGSMQLKAQAEWAFMITGAFKTALRLSERIRTWGEPFRTDIRTDLSYISKHFTAALRLNALHSLGTGLLGYAEEGWKSERLSVYFRQGIFRIDDWEDRIYAYERDSPGSFNVPAYYGRGVWTALTMNWKFARWGRMYMRAAATAYPFMEEKKPGRAELKFHFVFTLRES